jgi:cyclophilin family peptidyl-prolyl cis-trans isomerase
LASSQKARKRIKQQVKKRSRRGIYALFGLLILIIAGVSYYVYASGQSHPGNTGGTPIVYARIATSQGNITVELYHNLTPKTVDNFVNLANTGVYNNLVWHRIVTSPSPFVIQTGDPNTRNGGGDRNTWGQGSTTPIPFEYDSSLHNALGYLGMASGGAGQGGSCQFYININDNSAALDGKYAVFGKVISGMSVVNALSQVPQSTQYPTQPANPADAMMFSVTIIPSP